MKITAEVHTTGRALVAIAALLLASAAAAQQQPQPPSKPSFRADHYQVDATLSPANQFLYGKAKVEFVALQPSRTLQVEMSQDLNVHTIEIEGKKLSFARVAGNPLDVVISLPEMVSAGDKLTLDFAYSGPLANSQGGPSGDVRLSYVGDDSAYLLLSARWFPVTGIVGQRYTGTFNITVPSNFVVVGSGTSGAPSTVPVPAEVQAALDNSSSGSGSASASASKAQWLRYTFTAGKPIQIGTFAAGGLMLTPVTEDGISYSIYTVPKDKKTAEAYAKQISKIIQYYSSEFGPLTDKSLTVAQLSSVAPMDGVTGAGLILVDQRQWTEKPPAQLLARLVAHLWWDGMVKPAASSDVWLSDGLSRYSEVLYQGHAKGKSGLHKAVEDCAVGALMDESAAPIAQAWHLEPYTTAYQSIVRDKGAMVFHMLRATIGDKTFRDILHSYVQQYSGKTATINDFEQLVRAALSSQPQPSAAKGEKAAHLNVTAFFSQWLDSTGVPHFRLQYTVYRTDKGFKVVGKIQQNMATLNMPIEVEVKTEGNPVTKTVQVVGDSSEFSVDTFGMPKSNGVTLDPNNNVLKSTPDLRVRAMIAHGEALAGRGKFFKAVQQYQDALKIQNNNGLALFRMGEAMFFEQNYQAAANSFRDSLDAQIKPDNKWIVVWAHVYLGKIYDMIGQRARAISEYNKAIATKDDTAGALQQARKYLKAPYSGSSS